ncbi:MAG: DUF4381 family protein [Desulfobacterales bacterium]|jgi:hypothetical protein|nr:DUF4381 family protein [Desulfobacterales bacterium]
MEMTDIHDIKPLLPVRLPVSIPGVLWYVLAGLVLAGLILAAWCYWRRKRRSPQNEVPERVRPPDEVAYEALDRLEAASGLTEKVFYFRLSAILRGYLSGRFGVDALEMTTEELLPAVERMAMERSHKSGIRALALFSDPVKFADIPAALSQMEKDLCFVRQLVKETSPAIEASAPAEQKD